MKTTGSIWPKRSSTPCSPKSGEQDDQTAPIEAAASMAATVSGMLGIIAAMRSPFFTLSDRKSCCRREISACSSFHDSRRSTLSSPRKTIASPEPVFFSRFSAKFSVASGKNEAPGILSPSTSTRLSPLSPTMPQKSHTRLQNASRSSTDQR